MDYKNIDKAIEIRDAIEYLKHIRIMFIDDLCEQNERLQPGLKKDVNCKIRSKFVDLENKIIDEIKELAKEL